LTLIRSEIEVRLLRVIRRCQKAVGYRASLPKQVHQRAQERKTVEKSDGFRYTRRIRQAGSERLVAGVIENVITVNRMYHVLPFDGIDGNALAYNRENALGSRRHRWRRHTDGVIGSGASSGNNQSERQAAKDAATFTQVTSARSRPSWAMPK
jgi:hypothetical protein